MPHEALSVAPLDTYNQQLVARAHPPSWVNPHPAPRYNLVVIGAGTAGLVAAAGAAGLGAKVALVERDLMGGDCLNFGCVPSKALIAASRVAKTVRGAGRYGVIVRNSSVDFPAVMERMRALRAELAANDSAERFRDLGVDVFLGDARFTSPERVSAGGEAILRFTRAVIATGARAAAPPIEGLAEAGYLTNETVFSLTELPPRLAVIGAGPIGCELAQTFRRFGAAVVVLEASPQILPREERDAAAMVEESMREDGVRLVLGCEVAKVRRRGAARTLTIKQGTSIEEIEADQILVGVGRMPAVRGLDLEAAGVEYDKHSGIKVDDRLRSTNRRIYAAGDAASPYKFTHVSDATARIVLRNALFFGRAKMSALNIPWCTYTAPEIAHVGLYPAEGEKRGLKVTTMTQDLAGVDRALLDGEERGMVKVYVESGTDRILGATIVASHAGDMISEISTAMAAGMGLGKFADVIHPYPTQAEAIKKLGDAYNRTRLTPFVKRLFERWMAWNR